MGSVVNSAVLQDWARRAGGRIADAFARWTYGRDPEAFYTAEMKRGGPLLNRLQDFAVPATSLGWQNCKGRARNG